MIPDIVDFNLDLIICGSALGNESARRQAYYAHPANSFWRHLFETGLTDTQLQPENYRRLKEFGIGITDLCKTESGGDDQLSAEAYQPKRLVALVERYKPKLLIFSALNPARAFLTQTFGLHRQAVEPGLQPEHIGPTQIFVTTSSSPRYPNRARTKDLWHQAASLVGEIVDVGRAAKISEASRPAPQNQRSGAVRHQQ